MTPDSSKSTPPAPPPDKYPPKIDSPEFINKVIIKWDTPKSPTTMYNSIVKFLGSIPEVLRYFLMFLVFITILIYHYVCSGDVYDVTFFIFYYIVILILLLMSFPFDKPKNR